jgi:hypothetical protein
LGGLDAQAGQLNGLRNHAATSGVLALKEQAMRTNKRSNKKRSNGLTSGIVLAVASHAAMGVALGLVFALIVIWTPFFGRLALINLSTDPDTTMTVFVGTAVSMFGIGAALTGFILMMEDI